MFSLYLPDPSIWFPIIPPCIYIYIYLKKQIKPFLNWINQHQFVYNFLEGKRVWHLHRCFLKHNFFYVFWPVIHVNCVSGSWKVTFWGRDSLQGEDIQIDQCSVFMAEKYFSKHCFQKYSRKGWTGLLYFLNRKIMEISVFTNLQNKNVLL